jgi:hypothetical protein
MSITQLKSTLPASHPQRTRDDLSPAQRWLLQLMSEYAFGRIENLRVQDGQPVPDQQTRIVRSSRLGANDAEPKSVLVADYELGKSVLDMFAELARLENGVVGRIEFRYGEPCLLETSYGCFQDAEQIRH